MAAGDVTFRIPAELLEEAITIAAEMGLGVEEIAEQAFVAYVLGVREARLNDVDERSGSNVDELPGARDSTTPFEGTEDWLGGSPT
jgi:hypothetical protein